jgi:hypothetical protein
MNLGRTLQGMGGKVRGIHFDDVVAPLGLQRRRSVASYLVPAISCLLLGGMIGAGIALLFAPKEGKTMRRSVEGRVAALRDKLKAGADGRKTKVEVGMPDSTMP